MKQVYLLASGDLRESANQTCWPAQSTMEYALTMAASKNGAEIIRAHAFSPDRGHGFIASQREGMDVFRTFHLMPRLLSRNRRGNICTTCCQG